MKDLLVAVGLVALVAAFVWVGVQKQHQKPPEVTPRLLDCDADFFDGKMVRVKTEGMEPTENGTLSFRRRADLPYCVVVKFIGPRPEKIPAFVTGFCVGRQGETVIVQDCR